MKEATLKHFVQRLRRVFDESRYCNALVQNGRRRPRLETSQGLAQSGPLASRISCRRKA